MAVKELALGWSFSVGLGAARAEPAAASAAMAVKVFMLDGLGMNGCCFGRGKKSRVGISGWCWVVGCKKVLVDSPKKSERLIGEGQLERR